MKDTEIGQIVKAGYGLTCAPRRWWEQVKKDLKALGLIAIRTEPCVWIVFRPRADGSLQPVGGVCLHVDDFLMAGNTGSTWTTIRGHVHDLYWWSPWETGRFMQTGPEVIQNVDFSFTLTQERFCLGIKQIPLSSERRMIPEAPATPHEKTLLRAACGSCQWRGTQSDPHLLPYVQELHRRIPTATVADIVFANKMVREAHATSTLPLRVFPITGPMAFSWGGRMHRKPPTSTGRRSAATS